MLPTHWRRWLSIPSRYRRTDPDLLDDLNIGDRTYHLIKMLHMLISMVPVIFTVTYQRRHHGFDPAPSTYGTAIAVAIGLYVVLVAPISILWDRLKDTE